MCGFVGYFNSRNCGQRQTEKMLKARDLVSHRGPDDSGFYIDEYLVLGHVRLSIIDLSKNSAQPMISGNKRYVIAYNGEVYNYADMRKELEHNDIKYRSKGDTETILEYLSEYGIEQCLKSMDGMFAFAIWDRKEKLLTLARDRFGIKPCYFSVGISGEIAFASEIKALLDYSFGPDHSTVNAAMLGLGCAYDSHTLIKGIQSVCSGEFINFSLKGYEPKKKYFFRLPDFIDKNEYSKNDNLTADQIIDKTHSEMNESMRLCMISDAPLAVLASGGVDSSLIASIANENYSNLKLFHANVIGASETKAAEALAQHLKCELFTEVVTEQDTLDYTPIVTYHYEMPLMYHTNAVPFYLVSRLVRSHGVKVVLTGEGSDELFIGYPDMVLWPIIQRYRRALKRIQKLTHKIPGLGRLFFPIADENLANQLRSTFFRYELEDRRDEAERIYNFIKRWKERLLSFMSLDMCEGNIPPLLHRNDRLGMAWGIESRFPFLVNKVGNFALNLPAKYKVRKTLHFNNWKHPFVVDKWCVRKIAEKYLPRELSYRGKYAFRAIAYNNLNIELEFFDQGFVQDFYGLDRKSLNLMLEKSTSEWKSRMFLLEVWGRIFCCQNKPDSMKELIHKHVRYKRKL